METIRRMRNKKEEGKKKNGEMEEEAMCSGSPLIFCCICHCIIYSVCGKGVMVSPLDKKIVKLKQQKRFY